VVSARARAFARDSGQASRASGRALRCGVRAARSAEYRSSGGHGAGKSRARSRAARRCCGPRPERRKHCDPLQRLAGTLPAPGSYCRKVDSAELPVDGGDLGIMCREGLFKCGQEMFVRECARNQVTPKGPCHSSRKGIAGVWWRSVLFAHARTLLPSVIQRRGRTNRRCQPPLYRYAQAPAAIHARLEERNNPQHGAGVCSPPSRLHRNLPGAPMTALTLDQAIASLPPSSNAARESTAVHSPCSWWSPVARSRRSRRKTAPR